MEREAGSSQSKMSENPSCIGLHLPTTPRATTIAHPNQFSSHILPQKQSQIYATKSKKTVLGARGFAKLALFNDPSGHVDPQPIRRPLPAHFQLLSDSEDLLSDSEAETPPNSFIKKTVQSNDPFPNPDESDSDMSPGLSPSPSPKLLPILKLMSPLKADTQNSILISPMRRANSNTQHPDSSTTPAPFRRGLVTSTTDFDALLVFKDDASALPFNDRMKKRKRKAAGSEEKVLKEEPREVSMTCHDQVYTPEMSWPLRGRKQVAGENAKVAYGAGLVNRAGNSTGVGIGGKEKTANKRTARRLVGVPKRKYVWKDTKVKNKAHIQRKRKGMEFTKE